MICHPSRICQMVLTTQLSFLIALVIKTTSRRFCLKLFLRMHQINISCLEKGGGRRGVEEGGRKQGRETKGRVNTIDLKLE